MIRQALGRPHPLILQSVDDAIVLCIGAGLGLEKQCDQGWAVRFFDPDISGNLPEVIGAKGINQDLHSALGYQEQLDYGVIPS